jgi:hypothetical protein
MQAKTHSEVMQQSKLLDRPAHEICVLLVNILPHSVQCRHTVILLTHASNHFLWPVTKEVSILLTHASNHFLWPVTK